MGDGVHLDAEEYQRVLGEELRKLRRRRGWTRKELGERLQTEISLQTLATYELGTRQCSVVRLVELCIALGEPPHELLAKVHRRMFAEQPGKVRIDLAATIADNAPELLPLRRWAQRQPAESDEAGGYAQLDRAAIDWLAKLCGLDIDVLLTHLQRLSPRGNSPTNCPG